METVEIRHIARIEDPPLSDSMIEMVSIATFNHPFIKRRNDIDATRPEGAEQTAIHGIFVYVQTNRRHELGERLSGLLCERYRFRFFVRQIFFYLAAIGVIVGQRGIHLR